MISFRGEKSHAGVHKLGRSYVNLVTLFVAVISKLGYFLQIATFAVQPQ